ncbi:hypothetical protein MAR_035296, partial [Mya arenaria]
MPPCDKNEEGDSEQIEMKTYNFTVLTFSKKSQAKLTLNIRYTLAFFRYSSCLQTLQRSVLLTRSREFKQLTCWLPISVLDHLHVAINVTVAGEEYNTVASSTLDAMDQAITCKEGCKSDDIMFNTSYLCSKNGTLNHKPSARVLRVSFAPLDKGQTTLKHWSVTNSSISFQFNDKYNGIGRLEVSYRQLNADLYCYVYSDIRIVCDHVTSKSDPYDETESFGMFVIFGLIVMTFVQKLMGFHRAYKNRRDEVIRNSILNMHKIVSEPEAQPLRGHGLPSKTSSGKMFQRSVTQAMLEDLDENKCSILFLTLTFDQYTRDVIELLRNVLSIEGGIPSQCCFVPDVLSDYQTNRFAFIEKMTGNTNKILLFVFLTTLSYGTKEEKLIHDLLNHCLFKQRIIPQCKVVFLYLTDDD